jgi:phosphoribosylanthranilate isomerase
MISRQPLQVKICGMKHTENIEAVAALQPDYLGFIFDAASPRYVGPNFVVPATVQARRVAVFVNETPEAMLRALRWMEAAVVQLHGNESPDVCQQLKSQGITVIKAFAVHENFDFTMLRHYEPVVDYFLFDAKGLRPGGNGIAFNWDLLAQYHGQVPFFLSGGLSLTNLPQLSRLHGMNLIGVDFNSGVEVSPGKKDVEAVRAVLNWVHTFNHQMEMRKPSGETLS